MQSSRQVHGPNNPHPTMKVKRQNKNKSKSRSDQTNSSSQSRRPTTKSSVQMASQVSDIKSDIPPITILRKNPILHILPNFTRSTQEDTLTRSKLLTHQPDIPSSEPSSTQEQLRVPRKTLKIVSIQLRLNSNLSSKIPTPGQIQGDDKHHAQRTTLRNTSIPSPGLTKTRCQLKTQPNMSMILKISMTKPARKPKTRQDTI